ncbi:hypothetical protein HYD86_03970 [Mycoplasmopsis bovis]|nr:hypothetical protein [Mycoplasmopsis bovis]QQH36972.1 hypothetical protein HYD86_03970 [Mycoplasmopsis bovis]
MYLFGALGALYLVVSLGAPVPCCGALGVVPCLSLCLYLVLFSALYLFYLCLYLVFVLAGVPRSSSSPQIWFYLE